MLYKNGTALRDNVYDDCARYATDAIAKWSDLHREIIKAIVPSAL